VGEAICNAGNCCTPKCPIGSCGPDGCGGQCGPCAGSQRCQNDACCTPCGDFCCSVGAECVSAGGDPSCLTKQGTCPLRANGCAPLPGVNYQCNPDSPDFCQCLVSTSGETRCGTLSPNRACGQCTTDAQCASLPNFGVGSFCTIAPTTDGSFGCACGTAGAGFCWLPCPAPLLAN
jgi:hypothetical protein